MARILTDGFEDGVGDRPQIRGNGGITAAQKRTGNYSFTSGNNNNPTGYVLPSTYTELYTRQAFRCSTGVPARLVMLRNAASIIGIAIQLNFGAAGAASLQAYLSNSQNNSNGSLVATAAGLTWPVNEWHVLECHFVIHHTAGVIQVKMDGTQVINYSGITDTYIASIAHFCWGSFDMGYTDDIAVNDTSGSADKSWIGDGGVLAALVPNGAGTYTDLLASTGNAYQCVDEVPVLATSTWGDYVYESTVDKKSTYAMSDVTLPTGSSIQRLWLELRSGISVADGGKIATLLRSNSADTQGADQAQTLALARYASPEYLGDPGDSNNPWTAAKVNALEAGAVVR